MNQLAFNSSMPRSGSELIQAILSQHPEVECGTTSPLLEYFYGSLNTLNGVEAKSQEHAEEYYSAFVKGGIDAYVKKALGKNKEKNLYIDKSRGWIYYYNVFEKMYGSQPPVICMIRDAAEVLASMEQLHLRSDLKTGDPLQNVTTDERVRHWLEKTPVGLAIRRIINSVHELKQSRDQGKSRPILFVRYEDLCERPEEILKTVTTFLGLRDFEFDLDNIKKVPGEDERHFGGFQDLHTVKQKFDSTNAKPKAIDVFGEALTQNIKERCAVYQNIFGYNTEKTNK